ncbi:hypothetical protein PILCRDRAFT_530532 [Piloderma croceum F 1598]|uniref:Uncharacterized protein n=1 Tax=Piloderma croceum (strain F 1598) TaxID=765440 RepID=A0A0C3B2A0_PILCF|nr:hypothetical protein PILCRDRAFT_530532 [Piloderma croceum F 1598]
MNPSMMLKNVQLSLTELTTVLESARESLRYVHIGSTSFAPHGYVVFGIMPGQTPVSQGIFQELVVPTLIRGRWPHLETLTLEGLRIPRHLKHNIPSVVRKDPETSLTIGA